MSYTYRFRNDGIDLNTEFTVDEPFVDIDRVQGLSSTPYRITERQREGMDGGFVDAEFEGLRTIILEGTVYAASTDDVEPFMDQLKANYAPVETSRPFFISAPGVGQRIIFCKSYGVNYDIDQMRRIGTSPVQFQLVAENPRFYAVSLIQEQTGLASADTGRGYDKSYNYGYGPVTGGRVTINNLGNRDTDGIISIHGPITNPTVVHDVTGRRLIFDVVIEEGQFYNIDLRNKTVLLNGTANRRYTMLPASRWFLLSPGSNALRFQGFAHEESPPAPAPKMSIATRSAYR